MKDTLIATLLAFLLAISVIAQEAVLSHNSNLRSGPSSSSKVLGSLPSGTAVTVISKYPRSGYVKVKTTDGSQSGWVLQRNVAEAAATGETQPDQPDHTATQISGSRVGDAQIYPRSDLTPGKEDPSVSQDNISENICNKRWSTGSVRPKTPATKKLKQQTMQAYGFTDAANHYELDHLISLQNGGCPACVENLWPEAYGDKSHPMTQNERAQWNRENPGFTEVLPGALEKDLVENHVHDEICFGIPDAKMSSFSKKYPATVSVTLKRGQQILATDWYACYRNIMDGNKPCQ
jgi:uncharacterized protein YraI